MRSFILALLLVAACATQASAGWYAQITFAPQPRFGGPSIVYRGDWVPSYYARPQHSYNQPSYNRSRYDRPSHGHRGCR